MYTTNSIAEKWYAIYTKSRFERKINNALQKSGFQTFLPLIKENRVWSDRVKSVEIPLLPSYVFVKTHYTDFSKFYHFPGFLRFVSMEGRPCTLKEDDINLLRQLVRGDLQTKVSSNCKVGDVVRVIKGPLRGWEGRIERKMGESRIVFHFSSIQQAISVDIPAHFVEKCAKQSGRNS